MATQKDAIELQKKDLRKIAKKYVKSYRKVESIKRKKVDPFKKLLQEGMPEGSKITLADGDGVLASQTKGKLVLNKEGVKNLSPKKKEALIEIQYILTLDGENAYQQAKEAKSDPDSFAKLSKRMQDYHQTVIDLVEEEKSGSLRISVFKSK